MREYTQTEKDRIIAWMRRHLTEACKCCHWWNVTCSALQHESIACACECHEDNQQV